MNAQELRNIQEAYNQVHQVDEATAVASPAPGGRGRKNSYTKEIRTGASTKTSSKYSNVSDAKERMKTPLSRYDAPKMQLKKEEYVDEAQYTAPPQPQQRPAEVRKAPKNKLDPGATVGTGIAAAYVGNEIGKKLLKKKPGVRGVFEEADVFDSILEYLVAEGYADNNQEALYIMANLSEDEILEYRKLAAAAVGGLMALNMMKPGMAPTGIKRQAPEPDKTELVSKADKEKKDAEERRQADLYAQSRVDQARRTGLIK